MAFWRAAATTQGIKPGAVVEPVFNTSRLNVSDAARCWDLRIGYDLATVTFTNIVQTCEVFSDTPVVQLASGPLHAPVEDATENGDLIGPGSC